MTARALTYALPVEPAEAVALRTTLRRLAADRTAVRRMFAVRDVHFASVTLFDAPNANGSTLDFAEGLPPLLVVEQYVDEPSVRATAGWDPTRRLAERDPGTLRQMLRHCAGFAGGAAATPDDIAGYLRAHAAAPSVYFAANPRATCARVRREQALRRRLETAVGPWWDALPPHVPRTPRTLHAIAWRVAGDEIHEPHVRPPSFATIRRRLRFLLTAHLLATLATATLPLLLAGLALLRWRERHDPSANPDDLDPEHVRRLTAREDLGGQNHLASVIVVKPGFLRQATLRLALRVVALAAAAEPEGSLNGIEGVHHAQWTLLDGGRRLLFLTNYDGSWGSYLDDFVQFAATGMTAIWSNTVGFPPTRFLVLGGARDGRAFKSYVRRQQTTAALRFSGYPTLTVRQIAANCRLREGLARRPLTTAGLAAWARQC